MTAYSAISRNKSRSFFLMALFVVLIVLLGWLIDQTQGGNTLILPGAIFISTVYALIGYFSGDKIALAANGATKINKDEAPELYRLVENLAITSGLPTPAIYIIPSPAINAFATGRDPKHASIAVTAGALEKLERTELEGVIAHELSHVKNYDIRLLTVVAIFVGSIALLADLFLRSRLFGFRRDEDRENGNLGVILAIFGFILILLSPIIAQLIQLAISRKREFLADATGVILTRYPAGLANALRKIQAEHIPVATANSATAHLFLSNPLSSQGLSRLFATHPPIEERIAALEKMA